VLRGLYPDKYSREDNVAIYLGVSSYFGETRGRQYQDGRMMGKCLQIIRGKPRNSPPPEIPDWITNTPTPLAHIADVKFDGVPDSSRRPLFTNSAQVR